MRRTSKWPLYVIRPLEENCFNWTHDWAQLFSWNLIAEDKYNSSAVWPHVINVDYSGQWETKDDLKQPMTFYETYGWPRLQRTPYCPFPLHWPISCAKARTVHTCVFLHGCWSVFRFACERIVLFEIRTLNILSISIQLESILHPEWYSSLQFKWWNTVKTL